jgi:hypothetical protein
VTVTESAPVVVDPFDGGGVVVPVPDAVGAPDVLLVEVVEVVVAGVWTAAVAGVNGAADALAFAACKLRSSLFRSTADEVVAERLGASVRQLLG